MSGCHEPLSIVPCKCVFCLSKVIAELEKKINLLTNNYHHLKIQLECCFDDKVRQINKDIKLYKRIEDLENKDAKSSSIACLLCGEVKNSR